MLDTFQTRATDLHLPLFEVYAQFIRRVARAVGRQVRRGPPSRRRAPSPPASARTAATPRSPTPASSTGCRSTPAGSSTCCPRSSATGRRPPAPAAVADRPRPHARRGRTDEEEVGKTARRAGRCRRSAPARQPDVLPVAVRPRRRRLHARRPGTSSEILYRALAPYHDRLAIAGLAGISMGPVSGYAGRAAHAAGHLEEAEELLREAIATCVDLGFRPNEALARLDLGRVLRVSSTGQATAPRRTSRRRRHGRSPRRSGCVPPAT